MEADVQLPRSFWVDLLRLYDDFMETGKTDKETIEMLDKAGMLREGTVVAKEIMDAFPKLDFKDIEPLVRRGMRDKIVEKLRKSVD